MTDAQQHAFMGDRPRCAECGEGLWSTVHFRLPDEDLVLERTPPPQRSHTLHLDLDIDGYVRWRPGPCPYGGTGARPCLLVDEAPDCDWHRHESGAHVADAHRSPGNITFSSVAADRASYEACEARRVDPMDPAPCWGQESPDECDGTEHPELGHSHPIDGCGLVQAFAWDGMGATVMFAEDISDAEFPMRVNVSWDPDGGTMVLAPTHPVDPRTGRMLR